MLANARIVNARIAKFISTARSRSEFQLIDNFSSLTTDGINNNYLFYIAQKSSIHRSAAQAHPRLEFQLILETHKFYAN